MGHERVKGRSRVMVVLAVMLVLLFMAILLDLHMAHIPLTFEQTIDGLLGIGDYETTVVWTINGPRIVMGIIVGAGLALCGSVMQALFRNPLASPYILGLSSGASFGAALMIIMPITFLPTLLTVPASAFAFCFITVFLVYSISNTGRGMATETLILAGVAISAMFSAFVSFMTYISGEKMAGIVYWTMGDIGQYGWNNIMIVAPLVVLGSIFMLMRARDLNAMMLGEAQANDLGVNVAHVKKETLVMTALVTASCISFVGVIGFVGLVVPHVVRMLVGPDNRVLFPMSLIGGAAFLVFCDYISRSVMPADIIPIGIITSMVGAPYFIYLLVKRKKEMGW